MDAVLRHRPTRSFGVALAALLLTCAGPRGAAPGAGMAAERHSFPVLEYGALDIAVPHAWGVKVLELEPGVPASIRLDAPSGGVLFLAPLYNPDPPVGSPGLETARAFAELALSKAASSAAPPAPAIRALEASGGGVCGYWFVAVDKDYAPPPPGEQRWRNMLRGAASVGKLLVSFTWFDDAPGPDRDRVLALIADARHAAGGPGTASPGPGGDDALKFTPDPEAVTVPLAVPSPGGSFSVLVDLPGFHMYAPRPAPEGEGVLVLGQHADTGLVASVTLLPARDAADGRACRTRKLEAVRKAAPDLAELKTYEAGPAARASYVLRTLRGQEVRQDHAHTFLARDGWCVDVQVSKADPAPADAARLEAVLSSVRFASEL